MQLGKTRIKWVIGAIILFSAFFVLSCSDGGSDNDNTGSVSETGEPEIETGEPDVAESESESPGIIDIHNHLEGLIESAGEDFEGAAERAANAMINHGIRKMIVMPPPRPSDEHASYPYDLLLPVLGLYPDQFDFFAGGGTLNVMILEAVEAGVTGPELTARFEEKAEEIFVAGAIGYGEMGALHLSLRDNHPFFEAPPNHELFLLLADIAAENNAPIDIHMEAVAEDMDIPENLASSLNPSRLTANIGQFEELLNHNRDAIIIWSHAGWDNTGHRTVELQDDLLGRHPNLYMSLKVSVDNQSDNSVLDETGEIRSGWLALLQKYPDRFMTGSDQFYVSPHASVDFPAGVEQTLAILPKLPEDLASKIGYENAEALFYP